MTTEERMERLELGPGRAKRRTRRLLAALGLGLGAMALVWALGASMLSAQDAPSAQEQQPGTNYNWLIMMVLVFGVFYFLVWRPRKRERLRQSATVIPPAQPPSAPVTLDLGPQEAPQSISATFQTGTGRDGSLWRKVTGLHWRLIHPGWTEDQVRQLLDGPVKVRPAKAATGEAVSVWHYYSGVFRVSSSKGTVTFKDGKVVGFAAPPLDYARWVVHTPNPEA